MAGLSKEIHRNQGWSKICRNGLFQQPSDVLWFLLAFILFLVLGPFSAPVALMFVLKEGHNDGYELEPEPAKLG